MKIKLGPDIEPMVKTIADSANTTPEEMVNAIIWAAYYKPHAEWDAILQAFRDRQS